MPMSKQKSSSPSFDLAVNFEDSEQSFSLSALDSSEPATFSYSNFPSFSNSLILFSNSDLPSLWMSTINCSTCSSLIIWDCRVDLEDYLTESFPAMAAKESAEPPLQPLF